MRKRTRKELVVGVGVVLVLVAVALANTAFQRGNLRNRMEEARKAVEEGRAESGLELVPWPLLQKTKGTFRNGPKFKDDLLPYDGQEVNIVGFMVALNSFRGMTEFLLLPVPIECYFCQCPPMRDVLLVRMAEGKTVNLYNEPVMVNGLFKLHQGPKTKFFYTLEDTTLGPGKEGARLTNKTMQTEHLPVRHQKEIKLLEGMEPPAPIKIEE